MSSNGEVEVEVPAAYQSLPKEVTDEIGQGIKLFNKWSYEDVEIRDISLTYVPVVPLFGLFWGEGKATGQWGGGDYD